VRVLLMFDGQVGEEIATFLLDQYESDLGFVTTTRESVALALARERNIPTSIFSDYSSFESEVKKLQPFDLGLLAWWPTILPMSSIAIPINGFVNTHPSMLPHNRGKHYSFWAIIEEVPFGVSLHFVDEKIDCGDIISQAEIPYTWEDTGETLYRKATEEIVKLFKGMYPSIRLWQFERIPQEISKGSFHFAREIEPASTIQLDKFYTARQLINLFRARTFQGFPGCRFVDGDTVYEIKISIKSVRQQRVGN
jgi:methionyl-tRNA formyltransferase